jgi:hypothetical protein
MDRIERAARVVGQGAGTITAQRMQRNGSRGRHVHVGLGWTDKKK